MMLPTLAPEDMLLVLCAHASSHLWDQLQLLCDIAGLIARYPSMNWERVVEEFRTLGSTRLLLVTLSMAHYLLRIALPSQMMRILRRDRLVRCIVIQLCERLFDPRGLFKEVKDCTGLFDFEGSTLHIRTRERWQERAAYFVDSIQCHLLILTDADRAVVPLPGMLSLLHYPIRFARMLRFYGVQIVREPLKSLVDV